MNEIVPESPEKDSEIEDESSYIVETPQKAPSPEISEIIPIPNLSRIRKSLGLLDNNTNLLSTNASHLQRNEKKPYTDSPKLSRFKKLKENKLLSLQRVKVSLFHDKPKENEEEESFSLDTKSFYGTTSKKVEDNIFTLAPNNVKSMVEQSSRKKKNLLSCSSQKLSAKKRNKGEINRGVGHGIKRPKSKKSSLKNVFMEIEKQDENVAQKQNTHEEKLRQLAESSENDNKRVIVEEYNPNKKFFKCGHRSNATAFKKLSTEVSATAGLTKKVNSTFKASLHTITTSKTSAIGIQNDTNINDVSKVSESHSSNIVLSEKAVKSDKNQMDINSKASDNDYNSTENEERIHACEKQNDVPDFRNNLKITESEFEKFANYVQKNSVSKSLSPTGVSHIFKNVAVTKTIENIYKSAVMKNQSTINSFESTEQMEEKHFSVFSKDASEIFSKENQQSESKFEKPTCNVEENYCQIDAAQNVISTTQCKECNLLYYTSNKDDENNHLKYHNNFQALKFQGWKNERIVFEDSDKGIRIILIESNDFNMYQQKIMEVLEIVDQDLGLCDTEISNYRNKKIYFYVKEKTILGVLIAEEVKSAFKMIPELIEFNCCTSETSPVKCGINVVWTTKSYRKQGIATKLVDILRSTCHYEYEISIDDIAFSVPTPSGKSFAQKYTKSNDFKIY